MARGTLQSAAARVAVVLVLVFGTLGLVAGTGFFDITLASAGPANRAARGKLALICAAILVGGITSRSCGEFTRFGIAALISLAALCATAVTIFTRLHDAVSTLATDIQVGLDIFVVCQAVALDHVGFQTRTDVANAAWRKGIDALTRRRVHNVFSTSITLVFAQRATGL